MPLNIRFHFYRSPLSQVVPKTEQPDWAFSGSVGLMTETVARSARLIAPTRAQGDADLVLFVFMVRTIGRQRATLCRVRERHCCHSLPSEPDVKVSLHPAQAVAKPRVSGAGSHDGLI